MIYNSEFHTPTKCPTQIGQRGYRRFADSWRSKPHTRMHRLGWSRKRLPGWLRQAALEASDGGTFAAGWHLAADQLGGRAGGREIPLRTS